MCTLYLLRHTYKVNVQLCSDSIRVFDYQSQRHKVSASLLEKVQQAGAFEPEKKRN